jgi:hypothetical protein
VKSNERFLQNCPVEQFVNVGSISNSGSLKEDGYNRSDKEGTVQSVA